MMNKTQKLYGLCLSLLLMLGLSACDSDKGPSYENASIDNPELLAALQKQGFKVDGAILTLNDKALQLTSLDLSGAGLKSLKGLELFPKLEQVNLQNNDFASAFDFSALPKSIKVLDLGQNEIYDYKGLIDVDFESGKMEVLRKFDKLILPYSARYNMDALPFYFQNKGAETLDMLNKDGKAESYTTLREVPDKELRDFLMRTFKSIMNEDGKIIIGKPFSVEEENTAISLNMNADFQNKLKSLEGLEFILSNPFWKGTSFQIQPDIIDHKDLHFYLSYVKPNKYLDSYTTENTSVKFFDWSSSNSLRSVSIINDKDIDVIDLSNSSQFMSQKGGLSLFDGGIDAIRAINCPKLKKIILPKKEKKKEIYGLILANLPMLESINTENILGISEIELFKLPKLKDINLSNCVNVVGMFGDINSAGSQITLGLTKEVATIQNVKDFIIKMGKANKLYLKRSFNNIDGYDYTVLYDKTK